MKKILLFTLCFVANELTAQPLKLTVEVLNRAASGDTIYYKDFPKLAWDNFNGKPPATGNEAALTSSGFGFGAGMKYKEGKGTLNITVYCFFMKNKSWVKPNRKTDYILNHEQHHFDISYLAMAKFINALQQINFTMANYSAKLNEAYDESYDYMTSMQDEYDTQTKNGQLKDKQAEWVTKIDKLVAGYKNSLVSR